MSRSLLPGSSSQGPGRRWGQSIQGELPDPCLRYSVYLTLSLDKQMWSCMHLLCSLAALSLGVVPSSMVYCSFLIWWYCISIWSQWNDPLPCWQGSQYRGLTWSLMKSAWTGLLATRGLSLSAVRMVCPSTLTAQNRSNWGEWRQSVVSNFYVKTVKIPGICYPSILWRECYHN